MVAAFTYAFSVNCVAAYRIPADLIGDSNVGIVDQESRTSSENPGLDGAQTIQIEEQQVKH